MSGGAIVKATAVPEVTATVDDEATAAATLALPHTPRSSTPSTENPAAVYLLHMAEGSRRSMLDALQRVAGMMTKKPASAAGDEPWTVDELYELAIKTPFHQSPWARIDYAMLEGIRALLRQRKHYRTQEPLATATVNRHLAAIRGTMRVAFRLRQIDGEHLARILDVKAIKGSRLAAGRALSSAEIQALNAACDGETALGARDRALVALLYQAGLRCGADAAPLNLSAWNPGDGTLRVTGKGNKQRVAHIVGSARKALDRWLAFRGDAPGALFLWIAPQGAIARGRKRLSAQGIRGTLRRLAVLCATVARFTPHDLRRTFISDLLDRKVDILYVQRLAGHANVNTTQRYDRRPEGALREAASLLGDIAL